MGRLETADNSEEDMNNKIVRELYCVLNLSSRYNDIQGGTEDIMDILQNRVFKDKEGLSSCSYIIKNFINEIFSISIEDNTKAFNNGRILSNIVQYGNASQVKSMRSSKDKTTRAQIKVHIERELTEKCENLTKAIVGNTENERIKTIKEAIFIVYLIEFKAIKDSSCINSVVEFMVDEVANNMNTKETENLAYLLLLGKNYTKDHNSYFAKFKQIIEDKKKEGGSGDDKSSISCPMEAILNYMSYYEHYKCFVINSESDSKITSWLGTNEMNEIVDILVEDRMKAGFEYIKDSLVDADVRNVRNIHLFREILNSVIRKIVIFKQNDYDLEHLRFPLFVFINIIKEEVHILENDLLHGIELSVNDMVEELNVYDNIPPNYKEVMLQIYSECCRFVCRDTFESRPLDDGGGNIRLNEYLFVVKERINNELGLGTGFQTNVTDVVIQKLPSSETKLGESANTLKCTGDLRENTAGEISTAIETIKNIVMRINFLNVRNVAAEVASVIGRYFIIKDSEKCGFVGFKDIDNMYSNTVAIVKSLVEFLFNTSDNNTFSLYSKLLYILIRCDTLPKIGFINQYGGMVSKSQIDIGVMCVSDGVISSFKGLSLSGAGEEEVASRRKQIIFMSYLVKHKVMDIRCILCYLDVILERGLNIDEEFEHYYKILRICKTLFDFVDGNCILEEYFNKVNQVLDNKEDKIKTQVLEKVRSDIKYIGTYISNCKLLYNEDRKGCSNEIIYNHDTYIVTRKEVIDEIVGAIIKDRGFSNELSCCTPSSVPFQLIEEDLKSIKLNYVSSISIFSGIITKIFSNLLMMTEENGDKVRKISYALFVFVSLLKNNSGFTNVNLYIGIERSFTKLASHLKNIGDSSAYNLAFLLYDKLVMYATISDFAGQSCDDIVSGVDTDSSEYKSYIDFRIRELLLYGFKNLDE